MTEKRKTKCPATGKDCVHTVYEMWRPSMAINRPELRILEVIMYPGMLEPEMVIRCGVDVCTEKATEEKEKTN